MVNCSDRTRTGAFMAVWSVASLNVNNPVYKVIPENNHNFAQVFKKQGSAQARTGDLLRVKQT